MEIGQGASGKTGIATKPVKRKLAPKPMTPVVGSATMPTTIRRANIPRKILLFGSSDTGKTYGYIAWFMALLKMQPDAKMYVLCNDGGFEETLSLFPEEIDANIEYYPVENFAETLKVVNQIFPNLRAGDVLVIDHLQILWEGAEADFIKNVFGEENVGSYYENKRRENVLKNKTDKKGNTQGARLDGWKDWGIIKMKHNESLLDTLCRHTPCHLICTTTAEKIDKENAKEGDKEFWNVYWDLCARPGGEKRNQFRFSTIMYLTKNDNDEYYIRCTKNRGRKRLLAPIRVKLDAISTLLENE